MALPYVDEQLVEFLEKIFPDRCPSIEMTDREIWIRKGSVNVVAKLRDMLNEQTRNQLMADMPDN